MYCKSVLFKYLIIMKTQNSKVLVLTTITNQVDERADSSETLYAELPGRKIAYRSIGNGSPIILINRFRGILDTWDPLFLDTLAAKHRVITFDYSGIGYSTGSLPTDIFLVAKDVQELSAYLKLEKFAILGWSWGGLVAQATVLQYPELISKAIIVGANPFGKNEIPMTQAFLDAALKPINDLADEVVLFFEPASQKSVAAAKASHDRIAKRLDVSKIPSTMDIFQLYFAGGKAAAEDKEGSREKLKKTTVPLLLISGDNDISAAVENWFPLLRELSAQIIILPQTGHGPQHQEPELTVAYIESFLNFK